MAVLVYNFTVHIIKYNIILYYVRIYACILLLEVTPTAALWLNNNYCGFD